MTYDKQVVSEHAHRADESVAFLVLLQQLTSRVFRTRWGGLSCSPDPGYRKRLQNRVKTVDCYLIFA